MTISGLGPHGERAAPPERVTLLPEDHAAAKARGFRVAVVLHTLESDWARQQLSGIVGTLGDCGTAVTHVIDCAFSPKEQAQALDGLLAQKPDAVISCFFLFSVRNIFPARKFTSPFCFCFPDK